MKDNKNNLVSIILTTHGDCPYLQIAVESVIAQSYENKELLIMAAEVTGFAAQYLEKISDNNIRIIHKPNDGVSASRNQGIEHANGEWIALLDHDDVWHADKLEIQIDSLLKNKRQWSHTAFRNIDYQGKTSFFQYKTDTGDKSGNVLKALMQNNQLASSSVLFDKQLFIQAGAFYDYRVVLDYDLWLRMATLSELDYVERPLLDYRRHPDCVSMDRMTTYSEMVHLYQRLKTSPDWPLLNKCISIAHIDLERHNLAKCHLLAGDFKSAQELFEQISHDSGVYGSMAKIGIPIYPALLIWRGIRKFRQRVLKL